MAMKGETYFHKKRALVNGWRKLFNPELAFYWVQLANWKAAQRQPGRRRRLGADSRSAAQGAFHSTHRDGGDHRHR